MKKRNVSDKSDTIITLLRHSPMKGVKWCPETFDVDAYDISVKHTYKNGDTLTIPLNDLLDHIIEEAKNV